MNLPYKLWHRSSSCDQLKPLTFLVFPRLLMNHGNGFVENQSFIAHDMFLSNNSLSLLSHDHCFMFHYFDDEQRGRRLSGLRTANKNKTTFSLSEQTICFLFNGGTWYEPGYCLAENSFFNTFGLLGNSIVSTHTLPRFA